MSLGKIMRDSYARVPSSPEFIVHCCKELNSSTFIKYIPSPEQALAFKEVLEATEVTGRSR